MSIKEEYNKYLEKKRIEKSITQNLSKKYDLNPKKEDVRKKTEKAYSLKKIDKIGNARLHFKLLLKKFPRQILRIKAGKSQDIFTKLGGQK